MHNSKQNNNHQDTDTSTQSNNSGFNPDITIRHPKNKNKGTANLTKNENSQGSTENNKSKQNEDKCLQLSDEPNVTVEHKALDTAKLIKKQNNSDLYNNITKQNKVSTPEHENKLINQQALKYTFKSHTQHIDKRPNNANREITEVTEVTKVTKVTEVNSKSTKEVATELITAKIKTSDVSENNEDDLPDSIDDFEDMEFLQKELFAGISKYGFKYPSQIQAKTIHIINNGTDLIAQSQSGTGKTGAFTIGCLSRINTALKSPQAIIMAHTRTLVCQIMKVVENLSIDMKLKCCLCVGGLSNPQENIKHASTSHVLIGTPGRISDLLSRDTFDKKTLKLLIIDEADELLKPDFQVQVDEILNFMKNKQICLFSATFSRDSLLRTEPFLKNPYRITVEKEKLSLTNVKQYKINVQYDRNKFSVLDELFTELCIVQMIIFVNSTKIAIMLRNRLMDNNIEAGLVHGKMNNIDRENVLKEFRLAKIKTLITTDIMCRGIDVDDLRIVINYDIAHDTDTYIHRVGRSGRYGSEGIAINFCTYDDMHRIRLMERCYDIHIQDMPPLESVNKFLTGMSIPEGKINSSKMYNFDE